MKRIGIYPAVGTDVQNGNPVLILCGRSVKMFQIGGGKRF